MVLLSFDLVETKLNQDGTRQCLSDLPLLSHIASLGLVYLYTYFNSSMHFGHPCIHHPKIKLQLVDIKHEHQKIQKHIEILHLEGLGVLV